MSKPTHPTYNPDLPNMNKHAWKSMGYTTKAWAKKNNLVINDKPSGQYYRNVPLAKKCGWIELYLIGGNEISLKLESELQQKRTYNNKKDKDMNYNNQITQAVKRELNSLYMDNYTIAEEMAALSDRLKINNQLKEAATDLYLKNVNESLQTESMAIAILSKEVPLAPTDPSYPLNHYHIELQAQGRVLSTEDCGCYFMQEKRFEKITEYLNKAQAFSNTLKILDKIDSMIEFKSKGNNQC
jgi:hypothetical protein